MAKAYCNFVAEAQRAQRKVLILCDLCVSAAIFFIFSLATRFEYCGEWNVLYGVTFSSALKQSANKLFFYENQAVCKKCGLIFDFKRVVSA